MEHLYLSGDANQTAALANLCLLASIGLCPPTAELAQGLSDGSFFADFADCLSVLTPAELTYASAAFAGREADAVRHELNIEYTRLFTSPRRELVPIYESLIVHPDEKVSMFINPTVMHCEQLYRKTGFAFEEKNKFPGDHAGIELRYFACLLARRAMAMGEGNMQEAALVDAALTDFSDQHLVRWMAKFAAQVTLYTQSPFYLALAEAISLLAQHL